MAKTGLLGPYPLTYDEIKDTVVPRMPGAYALGRKDTAGRFSVRYVGRSDDDVKARLCQYIGSDSLFKFMHFLSPRAAFEKECELFHEFSPPGNRVHPSRPAGTGWTCPRCQMFDRPGTKAR
jgi:hypothetical protein